MQLRDYFRIIVKRGWIIVLAVILTSISAYGFSKVQTPVYRSSISLNVRPARLDWGLQQTIKALMYNYAGDIRSREVAAEVIDRVQLDLAPDQLSEKITVSPVELEYLIRIDADDYDPLIARDIAQTAAEVFVERINVSMLKMDQRDRLEISVRDYALPGTLHKPKLKINILAGAMFGLLAGALTLFVLEWLQTDIVRTSEDFERRTGLAVVGVVPVVGRSSSARSRRRGLQLARATDSPTGGASHDR
ncbi:MAG: YveK family protein [Anaerolineae bacterium]